MNQNVRDNENALLGGLVGTGFTLIDLLGAAAPAVSAAGHTKVIYNTATATVQASIDGAAFTELGSAVNAADPLLAADMLL